MDFSEWFKLVAAALGGGIIVKLLDIAYQEFRRKSESVESSIRFVDENLDPLLKAADELVGKLRSLADEDFKTLHEVNAAATKLDNNDFSSLLFLFAKFWTNIEIIRLKGLSVSLVKDERGANLQSFLDCLESRGVRIVDRISQRAIGELNLSRPNSDIFESLQFIEFVRIAETDQDALRWLSGLKHILSRSLHTTVRQRILRYGVVVHAMIDTLDPDHEVTRRRPSYPNKLSKKSWQDLKYRVFGRYLRFVKATEKYLGPPKRSGPR